MCSPGAKRSTVLAPLARVGGRRVAGGRGADHEKWRESIKFFGGRPAGEAPLAVACGLRRVPQDRISSSLVTTMIRVVVSIKRSSSSRRAAPSSPKYHELHAPSAAMSLQYDSATPA